MKAYQFCLVLLLSIASFQAVLALKCYQCIEGPKADDSKTIADLCDFTENSTQVVECDGVCLKYELTVGDKVTYLHDCGKKTDDKGACDIQKEAVNATTDCWECEEDKCNSATSMSVSFLTFASSIILAKIYF